MELIYHYDAQGMYKGRTEARISPRDGEIIVPANATRVAPPEIGTGECARWNGKEWSLAKETRGEWYHTETREKVIVGDIDADVSALTRTAPLTDFDYWTGTRWETDFAAQEAYNKEVADLVVLADLECIDAASIRSIRSILVALADNKKPADADVAALKEKESSAAVTREKIKK